VNPRVSNLLCRAIQTARGRASIEDRLAQEAVHDDLGPLVLARRNV